MPKAPHGHFELPLYEGVGAAMWTEVSTLQTCAADATEEGRVDSQQSLTT